MDGLDRPTVLEGFENQVLKLWPILNYASQSGLDVDPDKHAELEIKIQKLLEEQNAELVKITPAILLPLAPKRKNKETGEIEYGFKTLPKPIRIKINEAYSEWCKQFKIPWDKWVEQVDLRIVGLRRNKKTDDDEFVYAKVTPFKISFQSLAKYIKLKQEEYRRIGDDDLAELYKIPKVTKKGKSKETTGKKELEKLATQTNDPFLKLCQDIRSTQKMVSNDLVQWKPRKGKVHTEWRFDPPQGQLNTRSPNIQNVAKHTKIGDTFRQIIVAPSGYVYVELDMNSYHVATMAWLAQCLDYYRFSQLDPHSIFTSWVSDSTDEIKPVTFDMSNDEIRRITKAIKKTYPLIRQHTSKPAVLGNQLGLGPMRLFADNREHITSKQMAMRLQNELDQRFLKVAKTKDKIREMAHEHKMLVNPFGRIQRFEEVFKFTYNERMQSWVRGYSHEQNQVLAFGVQSLAFDMMFYSIIRLHEEMDAIRKYNFRNTIHDSVIFRPHIRDSERCLEDVSKILVQGCPQMKTKLFPNGLEVGVEYSLGRNWGKKTQENPDGMEEVGKRQVI